VDPSLSANSLASVDYRRISDRQFSREFRGKFGRYFDERGPDGLRKGQQVELAIAINLGAVTKLHRRTVVVVHASRGGTVLMKDAYTVR
jgi:hypothetical protein